MAGKDVNININGKDSFSSAANSASRSANSLKAALASLNGPIGGGGLGVGGILGGVGMGAAATAAVSFGVKTAAAFEQTTVAFKTMLKSGDLAKDLLMDLSKFARETPFEFTELTDASKKLLAFGVSAADIVPTLKKIGDVSAGIGVPIGEIAEIYGKARVQGRAFARDIHELTGRGIPVIQQLARQFGVADDAVMKLVEDGKVGFKNIEQAFTDMTSGSGQFAGLMEAQAQTLAGKFSNLKDAISQLAREWGGKLIPVLKLHVDMMADLLNQGEIRLPTAKAMNVPNNKNVHDWLNQGNAIDAGKAALKTEKDPAKRALIQSQIDAMQARRDATKEQIGLDNVKSDAFRAKVGAGISSTVGGIAGAGGAIGDLFSGVKRGFGEGGDQLGLFKEAFKLMEAEQGPQSVFKRRMAEIEKNPFLDQRMKDQEIQKAKNKLNEELRGGIAPDRGEDEPLAKAQQERRGLAPLTEARFLTSAPGYAADPATKAAQENATVSKEQLVVLRAMERKMQRQARLGVL